MKNIETVQKTYDLIKPEEIERFFKDYYGSEKQATATSMKTAAPYAFDKINKFFNAENSLPIF